MTKILVVEDETVLRHNIVSVLEFEGYETLEAENGVRGIELVFDEAPDLIVCDIMMPEMDGFEMLAAVRSHPNVQATPFLFLTARAEREVMRQGMDLGANDYIAKPFAHAELLSAIDAVLQKHQLVTENFIERIEDLRTSVTTSIPHELRTPLTSLVGYLDFIIQDVESLSSDEIQSMCQRMMRATLRLRRLTENWITYAHLHTATINSQTVHKMQNLFLDNPTATKSILEEITEVVADRYDRAEDCQPTFAEVNLPMPREDILRIYEEIIDNAFKFSKKETPVRIETYAADGKFWLEVEDQGWGMSKDQIETAGAFIQFERRLHEQQGIGLGLAIATKLVDLYGGHISIESQLDLGTKVIISLPIEI